ncbi:MAG: response regulator, partial [Gemmatimonadetes bacterium]|nr:response regulator [Gemmatimonadota bacterium]
AAVERLTSFIEAGRAMSDILLLPDLMDFFLGLVTRELDVERASLMLLDEEQRELRVVSHRGVDNVDVDSVRIPIGEGIAGRVAETGQYMMVEETEEALGDEARPHLANSFISAPIKLSIPIRSQQHVLGVINVTNRRTGVAFTDEDLAYLGGMAGQLAVAIDRAAHFQDLQGAYDDLRQTQGQLVASERLNVVGRMAAGVAHEFNNSLSVILGRAENALASVPESGSPQDAKFRSDLEAIIRSSLQGAASIRRIQDYTRIRRDAPTAIVDLNQVVRDAVEMNRPKWKGEMTAAGCPITMRTGLTEVRPVEGDVHELEQVLGNLIFNAVDAMPDGGTIDIRTFMNDDRVCLEVRDSGTGMDAETREQLFEPFFTTKPRGNGLGMSIVFGIITRHGGTVAVDTAPGEGTTLQVLLPPAASAEPAPDSAEAPETPGAAGPGGVDPERTGRILLVDDETDVLETLLEALEAGGHTPTGAASGEEALERFDPGDFDLVITDLNMPGMSGTELLEQLKTRRPDIPVGILSGWIDRPDSGADPTERADFILPKPCRLHELLDVVQRHLSDSPSNTPTQ